MAEVDTSSYLKPQPPGNPLDTITKFGQAASTIGDLEAGKAVQGAIGPDGEIDRNALAQTLKGTVAGSMKAIPTLNAYETLRQAGHVADEAGYDNFRKRMELVNNVFAPLASKDNPTIHDVNSAAAQILDPKLNGSKYGLTFPVVMNALKNFRGADGRPLEGAALKQRILEVQSMSLKSLEAIQQHKQQSTQVDTGTDIRQEPTGTNINPRFPVVPKRIPVGTAQVDTDPNSPNYRKSVLTPPQPPAPSMEMTPGGAIKPPSNALSGVVAPQSFDDLYKSRIAGGPAAGLAPGVAAAATKTAEASADMGNQLVAAANQAPITEGILQNMDKTLGEFTSGPGADWTRVGKAFANTVLPAGMKFDPKSIASQEEFNKQAYSLAQSQFQALGGTGTDAKLASAASTSPNELLSKEGNKGIVQLLRGNNDALKVKAKEWNKWKKDPVHGGEDSYAEFSDRFNEDFNPRVFQFKYIPTTERNAWYQAMSPDDRRAFEKSAKIAKQNGWIKKGDLQ